MFFFSYKKKIGMWLQFEVEWPKRGTSGKVQTLTVSKSVIGCHQKYIQKTYSGKDQTILQHEAHSTDPYSHNNNFYNILSKNVINPSFQTSKLLGKVKTQWQHGNSTSPLFWQPSVLSLLVFSLPLNPTFHSPTHTVNLCNALTTSRGEIDPLNFRCWTPKPGISFAVILGFESLFWPLFIFKNHFFLEEGGGAASLVSCEFFLPGFLFSHLFSFFCDIWTFCLDFMA